MFDKNFTLNCSMQVALREQAAKLFSVSLTRNLEDSAIHVSCMLTFLYL